MAKMIMKMNDILIVTITPSDRKFKQLGLVYGASCQSKSLIHDMCANLKNWTVGGSLNVYSKMMLEGMNDAVESLKEAAKRVGADAIYGFRIATPSVSAGAAEIIVYGTAVKYLDNEEPFC